VSALIVTHSPCRCKKLTLADHKVVETQYAVNESERWDASAPIDRLPRIVLSVEQLPKFSKKLAQRLLVELEGYFPEPSDRQCLSMIIDPIMLTTGLPLLRRWGHQDTVSKALAIFKTELLKESRRSFQVPPPTLTILAFNKTFLRERERAGGVTLEQLVDSLDSAASTSKAAESLLNFFDLEADSDVERDDEGPTDSHTELLKLLKNIGNKNGGSRPEKRPRLH
jgi:hypothetical protein